MINSKHLILPFSLLCLAISANTQAEETQKELSWTAAAELGFIKTSGNTETETLNAKFNAETTYTLWTHKLLLEALKSASDDVRSAEKYRIEAQSDYALSDASYVFGLANWENDNFSGLNYQAAAVLGYGYKALDTATMKLNFEAAPGYRITEDENDNTEEDGIIRLAEIFAWNISETSTLDQSLKVESGDSNTETRFGVALTNQINGSLSMKVGYNIKHNSDVAPGADKTDRETAVTLVYKL
jgi:putative salt-induced outer membrane protein